MKTNMVKQKRGQILNLARGNLSGHVVFGLYNFGAKPPVIREHCANLLTINSDIAGVYWAMIDLSFQMQFLSATDVSNIKVFKDIGTVQVIVNFPLFFASSSMRFCISS